MAELSVHVVTAFPWQAVMFYFNSHISPLQFPLTGWNFTRVPRGCHFVCACCCYPSSGNSPLHTPNRNMLHPTAKRKKIIALAGTLLGFSFSSWLGKGQAVGSWILMVSWTHTGNFSGEVVLEVARFFTHDGPDQSCHFNSQNIN